MAGTEVVCIVPILYLSVFSQCVLNICIFYNCNFNQIIKHNRFKLSWQSKLTMFWLYLMSINNQGSRHKQVYIQPVLVFQVTTHLDYITSHKSFAHSPYHQRNWCLLFGSVVGKSKVTMREREHPLSRFKTQFSISLMLVRMSMGWWEMILSYTCFD